MDHYHKRPLTDRDVVDFDAVAISKPMLNPVPESPGATKRYDGCQMDNEACAQWWNSHHYSPATNRLSRPGRSKTGMVTDITK